MKKQKLMNDVMQSLLMAAVVATALPAMSSLSLAGSTDLSSAVNASGSSVFQTILQLVNYGAYTIGGVMGISGVMAMKKHAENPSQAPLGAALAKLGAGAALLAAPSLISIMQNTGSDVVGTGASSVGSIAF